MGDQLVFGALAWNQPYNTSLKLPFSLFLEQGNVTASIGAKKNPHTLARQIRRCLWRDYQSWLVVVGATNRTGFQVRAPE